MEGNCHLTSTKHLHFGDGRRWFSEKCHLVNGENIIKIKMVHIYSQSCSDPSCCKDPSTKKGGFSRATEVYLLRKKRCDTNCHHCSYTLFGCSQNQPLQCRLRKTIMVSFFFHCLLPHSVNVSTDATKPPCFSFLHFQSKEKIF